MVFGNGVKNIQAAAYNGARTVLKGNYCILRITRSAGSSKIGHDFSK